MILEFLRAINEHIILQMTVVERLTTLFFIGGTIYLIVYWDECKEASIAVEKDLQEQGTLFEDILQIIYPEDDEFDDEWSHYHRALSLGFENEEVYLRFRILEIYTVCLLIVLIMINIKNLYIGYGVVQPYLFPDYNNEF